MPEAATWIKLSFQNSCTEFKKQDSVKLGLQLLLFHLQIWEWSSVINQYGVSKPPLMTNTLLEVLITGAGEKLMAIQFKQRSSQLETIDELWKVNTSTALHPSSQAKPAQCSILDLLGTWELQDPWEAPLCSWQPWHHPMEGEEERLSEHPYGVVLITHSGVIILAGITSSGNRKRN